jgi:penicillin amidase/acyl-homoserine-lactone acylase
MASRRHRWLVGLATLVLLAGAWRVLRPHLRPAPPPPDAVTRAHVAHVRILRDTWGVAHVFGHSDADAAFGLAYANAEDDWPTIQAVLAATRGQLGLLYFSKQARANDYFVGLAGIAAETARQLPTLSPDVRAVLDGYARGLAYYAYRHPDEVDGRLLPITAVDVAAGFAHKLPIVVGATEVLGALYADPPGAVGDPIGPPPIGAGSNAHALHRRRSSDDVTRLNVNSHQPWSGPVAWYEVQVHSDEGWNMTGGTFPGAPVVLHGANDHLGWAHTVNSPDLVDVYKLTMRPGTLDYRLDDRWVPLEVTEVAIPIDTGFFTFIAHKTAYRSVHGPVLETERGFYALRWAGMDRAVRAAEQWFRMNKAQSLDEWQAAMALGGVPKYNTVYADRDHVLYIYNALLPVRAPGFDYTRVLPGDRADLVWQTYLPSAALPQVLDPRSGFVQNCNSTPFGTTVGDDNPRPEAFPASAGIETAMTNRALRSNTLLGGEARLGRDEFLAMKWDRGYAPDAPIFTQLIRPLVQSFAPADDAEGRALAALAGWDGRTDEGSTAATIALAAWRFRSSDGQEPRADKTADPAVALRRGLALLGGRTDVPLGELQRLRRGELDLPLGGGPDVLNAIYTHQQDGKLVAYQGDSFVMLAEFGADGLVASTIQPYGASNRPGARHYADQAPLFARRALKPSWRTEAELREHLEREYHPGEELAP